VSPKERAAYRELVRSRADERVPVALLVGHKEFWSLRFKVTPDVLIPRPDTETLVAAALDLLPANGREARVLEVGTGSGAVAVAIAAERPTAQIVATDISQAALEIARENADENGVGDRITWAQGDLFAPVAGCRFDLIVSNPPYVAEKQRRELAPELAHEPSAALFAGEEGTEVLYALIDGAADALTPGGAIALELDSSQSEGVARRLGDAGFGEVSVRRDLAQRPRVVSARKEG